MNLDQMKSARRSLGWGVFAGCFVVAALAQATDGKGGAVWWIGGILLFAAACRLHGLTKAIAAEEARIEREAQRDPLPADQPPHPEEGAMHRWQDGMKGLLLAAVLVVPATAQSAPIPYTGSELPHQSCIGFGMVQIPQVILQPTGAWQPVGGGVLTIGAPVPPISPCMHETAQWSWLLVSAGPLVTERVPSTITSSSPMHVAPPMLVVPMPRRFDQTFGWIHDGAVQLPVVPATLGAVAMNLQQVLHFKETVSGPWVTQPVSDRRDVLRASFVQRVIVEVSP